jgi:hypothetical protein
MFARRLLVYYGGRTQFAPTSLSNDNCFIKMGF